VWIDLRIPDRSLEPIARAGFAHLPMRTEMKGGDVWIKARVPNRQPDLDRALRVLVAINVAILRRAQQLGLRFPPLYESGIRYQREPDGREWWQTVLDNVQQREGDCEDLGCHRAAELIATGEDPTASAKCIKTGPRMFHCIATRARGTILEDPSAALGMTPLTPAARRRAIME
jgi:hypothetical protein